MSDETSDMKKMRQALATPSCQKIYEAYIRNANDRVDDEAVHYLYRNTLLAFLQGIAFGIGGEAFAMSVSWDFYAALTNTGVLK